MTETIGHWLQLAARMHRARLAAAIEDLGLFPGQEQVILHLASHDGITAGDLAEKLKVRPPTISKTLQRLSAQGLIERRDHTDDARKTTLLLSKEGRKRAESLRERIERVENDILEGLDGKDAKRLRKLLKRVSKSLAAYALPEADEVDDGE